MDKKAKGLIPPGLAYLADNVSSKQNVMGESKGAGAKWAKDLKLPKEAETVFFAGCGYQYTKKLESLMSLIRGLDKSVVGAELPMAMAGLQKKIGLDLGGMYGKVMGRGGDADAEPLLDAVKVLKGLGVQFGYLGEDEPCCGGLLYYIGMQKDFAKRAQGVYQTLKSHGVKRMIGMVPSCTYAMRSLIPPHVPGYDIEVKHFSEVVAEKVGSVQMRYPKEVKVAYHDPCQMARYLGLSEEPRRILRAIKGIDLVDAAWTAGEWSTCCGGGGGFEAVFPELSHLLAVNRARELSETGAQIIVTNCPGCIMQLKAGLKEMKNDEVEVLDLAQVVAAAMGV
jgi:Fe-S oxidoreductase